jgi:hypothetical protein
MKHLIFSLHLNDDKSMKQIQIFHCLAGVFMMCIFACTKTNSDKTLSVTIVEYKTNAPVPGSTIDFFKQGAFDFWNCGCYVNDKYATGVTDAKGICTITQSGSDPSPSEIVFSKTFYYSVSVNLGKNVVETQAPTKIHLLAVQNHPQTVRIELFAGAEQHPPSSIGASYSSQDSVIQWMGYGDQVNTFSLNLWDSVGTLIETTAPQQQTLTRSVVNDVYIKY